MPTTPKKPKAPKRITRYTHEGIEDPATPETGHTADIEEEQVVTLDMDNGWSKGLEVGRLDGDGPVIVDMDPAVDPVLMWSGKRTRRDVPLLPLQRNEIISESRVTRIIARARAAEPKDERSEQFSFAFADLEKELREKGKDKRVEFYSHDEGWKNKLICGDSLKVMESLIHYEGLGGKVQMIYMDPPYALSYNSNFQQRIDSTKNDQKDHADDILTIRAYHDTWILQYHSYLSYLSDQLYVARDLLHETGSIFVQINQENLGIVSSVMSEVFGHENLISILAFVKTSGFSGELTSSVCDYLVWFAKSKERIKHFPLYRKKVPGEEGATKYRPVSTFSAIEKGIFPDDAFVTSDQLTSQDETSSDQEFQFRGRTWTPPQGLHWKTTVNGLTRLAELKRIIVEGDRLRYLRFLEDFPVSPRSNVWTDIGGIQDRSEGKLYSVQTAPEVIRRCIAMTTEPGDLVFDPTCGSGTTAHGSERLGRRWITCDSSRVALNIARKRLLGSTFPHFPTLNGTPSSGFNYTTVQHVTLESLAKDLEPERVELVDQPDRDNDAIRVTGPFEIMTLGRYSLDDWKGYKIDEEGNLENYISVVARLYRKDAAPQKSEGFIHAVAESEEGALGISVGPISGRVTARQLHDAASEAESSGISEIHVLGWAFEANVGEIKGKIEAGGNVKIELVMLRPDTLAEGLKVAKPDELFSPLALPEVEIQLTSEGYVAILGGLAVFDRKKKVTEFKRADSGYVSAWYLDEDYDGDCFVDTQMFFDFKKKPAIEKTLGITVDPMEWKLRLSSDPFKEGQYKRIAIKVVDVYGNESTVVKDLV